MPLPSRCRASSRFSGVIWHPYPLKRKHVVVRAFSLVELTIAISIVSFTMLTMLGSVGIGLNSVQDSMVDFAMANISQQIRSQLQQISFNSTNPDSIQNLVGSNYYYSPEGDPSSEAGAYYKAVISATNAVAGSTSYDSTNARMVTVNVAYPQGIASAQQKRSVISIFVAKQSRD
jgi:uncharacterized protein (TIGR02598 family)